MGEIWVTVKRGFYEFGRAGILADGFTLRDCYSMCARSAYGCLVLYTIFDAFVRPFVRSSVRSFVRKNRLFSNCFKSRELASRANTKVICKKMTLFLSYFFANYLT